MRIQREELLNRIDGKEVYVYTLYNENTSVKITNYGGIILSLITPDKFGAKDDIVLGYDNFEDYKTTTTYFGAIIGRCANRIGKAEIDVDGIKYKLAQNDGNNHLHGGVKGFNRVVWDSEVLNDKDGEYLKLSYLSKDGEEEYPGNLEVTVEYKLTKENELIINYYGKCDASGDVLDHKVRIYAKNITAADSESIPTGEIRSIEGTPMDFSNLKCIGADIDKEYDQLINGNGYDHNWIIDDYTGELKKAAEVILPR